MASGSGTIRESTPPPLQTNKGSLEGRSTAGPYSRLSSVPTIIPASPSPEAFRPSQIIPDASDSYSNRTTPVKIPSDVTTDMISPKGAEPTQKKSKGPVAYK